MPQRPCIRVMTLQGRSESRQPYRGLMVGGHESLRMELVRETADAFLVVLLTNE